MKKRNFPFMRLIWAQCKFVIRRVSSSTNDDYGTTETYQNLEGQVQISDDEISQPFMPKFIFRKNIPYLRKAFNWSVKRKLPKLKINLQTQYFVKLKEQDQIIDLFSQISAAYIAKRQQHYYLEQVELMGQRMKTFNEYGNVVFSKLKFPYSSMRIQKRKICIIVSICARCCEQEKLIIKTYFCSEIFLCPFIKRNYFKKKLNIGNQTAKHQQNKRNITQNDKSQQQLDAFCMIS